MYVNGRYYADVVAILNQFIFSKIKTIFFSKQSIHAGSLGSSETDVQVAVGGIFLGLTIDSCVVYIVREDQCPLQTFDLE